MFLFFTIFKYVRKNIARILYSPVLGLSYDFFVGLSNLLYFKKKTWNLKTFGPTLILKIFSISEFHVDYGRAHYCHITTLFADYQPECSSK